MAKQILKKILQLVGILDWFRSKVLWKLMRLRVLRNYKKHIARMKTRKTIRVFFLVSENSKWSAQSLYDALVADDRFQPAIVISSLVREGQSRQERRAEYDRNRHFFASRGMRVLDGYDFEQNADICLETFSPDVVFYQQPWVPPMHEVYRVSRFALTCYIPYGFQLSNLGDIHYNDLFQRLIWRTFTFSDAHKKLFREYAPEKDANVEAVGYPKLDVYLDDKSIDADRIWSLSKKDLPEVKRVIWAPHYAFTELSYATFLWNYKFFLEYARSHPATDWIVKPHPRLKFALEGLLPAADIQRYFQQWQELPNARIYEMGDYFDIMRTSDAMITDSCSFLAEYLPTGKPILHLISPDSTGFNEVGTEIVRDFYKVHDTQDLAELIQRVILDGDDFLKEKRLKALDLLGRPGQHSGNEIRSFLSAALTDGVQSHA